MNIIEDFKKPHINYTSPVATKLKTEAIINYAERVSIQLDFEPGKSIFKCVHKLGGEIKNTLLSQLEENVAGAILVHGQNNFDVFIAHDTDFDTDQFTVAHEIGHYLLHSKQGQIKIEAAKTISKTDDSAEHEANWFALAFLTPISKIKHFQSKGYDSAKIAELFGISENLMNIRLKRIAENK